MSDAHATTAPTAERARDRDAPPAYERHAELHVLRLHGDDYEMGYQHGALLSEAIARGPLPYFDRYVERMLAVGAGPRLGRVLGATLKATVGRRIAAGLPARVRRALAGDAAVRRAAERGLHRRWKPRRFGVEFAFADVPVP
jgi:hypothetical protein